MKSGILFVDDEPNVLHGLKRMLRGLRDDWDIRTASSASEALAVMAANPADVVVSDMRMPGMDGAELLAEVRRLHPETVRVILSGYADEGSILRTVGVAHQYLAKPCGRDMLTGTIRRALALRAFLGAPELRRLLAGLTSLPTPPATFLRLIDLLNSPRASTAQAAEVIADDVALTAEVLKLTNSAYFALPTAVTSPLHAARILGFETLKTLVLRTGIFRHFQGSPALGEIIEHINGHSLMVAHMARRIAELERLGPVQADQAFCAGMLSTVGALVLCDQMPDEFERVKIKARTGLSLTEAERRVFGATQAAVGAYLLGLWGFGDPIVEAVAYHLHPSACVGGGTGALLCLHAAAALGPQCPVYGRGVRRGTAVDESFLREAGAVERLPVWRRELERLAEETMP